MKSHRDLAIWQRSMVLAKHIYDRTRKMPRTEDYGLSLQMRRAAVSIPSNIAEGYARASSWEFVRFLRIANGSLAELETQILLASYEGMMESEILKEVQDFERILHASIRTIKEKC